jgi:hypothetical protein
MTVRDGFVKRFGEENASAVERAAEKHCNGVNDQKRGSDPFKWACLIVIGYECISRFREYHKIDINPVSFKQWCIEDGNLGEHDGDVDYLSLFAGVYGDYVSPRRTE